MKQRKNAIRRGRPDCARFAGPVRLARTARTAIAPTRTMEAPNDQGRSRRAEPVNKDAGKRARVQRQALTVGTKPIVTYEGVSSATKKARIKLGSRSTSTKVLAAPIAMPRISLTVEPASF